MLGLRIRLSLKNGGRGKGNENLFIVKLNYTKPPFVVLPFFLLSPNVRRFVSECVRFSVYVPFCKRMTRDKCLARDDFWILAFKPLSSVYKLDVESLKLYLKMFEGRIGLSSFQ